MKVIRMDCEAHSGPDPPESARFQYRSDGGESANHIFEEKIHSRPFSHNADFDCAAASSDGTWNSHKGDTVLLLSYSRDFIDSSFCF